MKKYKYEIFTAKLEEAIEKGHLQAGDALPTVRAIKETYQLSTSSVQSGYDYLVFKGLVKSSTSIIYWISSCNHPTGYYCCRKSVCILRFGSHCPFAFACTGDSPTPKGGIRFELLKKMCGQHAIKALVVTPNFHNPTGILLTEENKEKLYQLAVQYQMPILENDIYGDLYFQGERPINIKNFDTRGLVLTFSSFSKTVAPGLRLGWLAAGKYFAQAERLKFALGRSVSPLNQEVIIRLLQLPSYDKHLRIFRQNLERQAMQLVRQFNASFPSPSPDALTVQAPKGGYSIWGQLPATTDKEAFYTHCTSLGISLTPGETFSFTTAYESNFRAVYAQRITPEDLTLIKALGDQLKITMYR
ncbi:aminotransferase class I/II-fold pyridoxal phosphate-dependent enzyme [Myroides sp. C15-4]|uniref:aminotransferase class I/II-fold pyridoxal phosphate-dependent enzyme n=1 Tax=Myroides sp. C15-4 TaxID=3400532 RepID=UPI003D2F81FE